MHRTFWTTFLALSSVIYATQVVSPLESALETYFETKSKDVCLSKDSHAPFMTFEEHDMNSYWGFFLLPESDDDIKSGDSISFQSINGLGVCSYSRLFDSQISAVFKTLQEQKSTGRLGFFKLFENRKSNEYPDAYLHFLRANANLPVEISNAPIKDAAYQKMVRDLCYFVSDDSKWAEELVGITFTLNPSDRTRIKIGILISLDMDFVSLRELQQELAALKLWSSPELSKVTLSVDLFDTRFGDEEAAQALETSFLDSVQKKFNTDKVVDLNDEWLAFATAFPQVSGSFTRARLLGRRSSFCKTSADFNKVFHIHCEGFPGVLAKNSYTGIFKVSKLEKNVLDNSIVRGNLFNINYNQGQYEPFEIVLSGMTAFSKYYEAARLVFLFTMTYPDLFINGVFVHFDAQTGPKSSKLTFEFWATNGTRNNVKNSFRNSLSEYLSKELTE